MRLSRVTNDLDSSTKNSQDIETFLRRNWFEGCNADERSTDWNSLRYSIDDGYVEGEVIGSTWKIIPHSLAVWRKSESCSVSPLSMRWVMQSKERKGKTFWQIQSSSMRDERSHYGMKSTRTWRGILLFWVIDTADHCFASASGNDSCEDQKLWMVRRTSERLFSDCSGRSDPKVSRERSRSLSATIIALSSYLLLFSCVLLLLASSSLWGFWHWVLLISKQTKTQARREILRKRQQKTIVSLIHQPFSKF